MVKKFCFSLILVHNVCMPTATDSVSPQYNNQSETSSSVLPSNTGNDNNLDHKKKTSEAFFIADTQTIQHRLIPNDIWLNFINFTTGLISGLHGTTFHPIYHVPLAAFLNICLESAIRLAPADKNSPPALTMKEAVVTHVCTYHEGLLVGYIVRYLSS